MKKTWIRLLLWMAVIMTAAMIFGFSGQDGESSMGMSDGIVVPVLTGLHRLKPEISAQTLETLYWTLQTIIRKGAHLTEFAVLGFWLRLLCASYGWPAVVAWISGTLYAATDELHQVFSAGRCAKWTDVLIDSSGVLIGICIAAGLLKHCAKKRRREQC